MRADRGFSLIETMVAAAMLGLITAAFVSTMSFAATTGARTRLHAIAAGDAAAQMERFVAITRLARASTPTERCALLTAPGGPLDVSRGGAASGTCPLLVASEVPVPDTGLRRTVRISEAPADDGRPAWLLQIEERSPVLRDDVIVVTSVPK